MGRRRGIELTVLALVAVGFVAIIGQTQAHQVAFELTTIELNATTNSLEVIHRIFAHDLEPTLEAATGRALTLDDLEALEPDLKKYVDDRFDMQDAGGQALPLTWVGAEIEGDMAWIYQETPYDPSLKGVRVRNALLFDYNSSQINSVNVLIGEHKDTLVFTTGDDAMAFIWAE